MARDARIGRRATPARRAREWARATHHAIVGTTPVIFNMTDPYLTDRGVTRDEPGITFGGVLLNFAVASSATAGDLVMGIAVFPRLVDPDDVDPNVNQHLSWMYWDQVHNPLAESIRVRREGADAVRIKAMRKAGQLGNTILLVAVSTAGNWTLRAHTSTLMLLP